MSRFGKFRVVAPLAQGHVSVVYLCDDPDLAAPVAVKAFALSAGAADGDRAQRVARWRQRFLREARWLGRIEHPNIVHARSLDSTADGAPYFVMPYHAANLEFEIGSDSPPRGATRPRRRPASPRRVLEVLDGMLAGLAGLHSAGLVHRDLKPANVLLSEKKNGSVKLCDLGMARFPEDRDGDDPAGVGAAIGSDGYVAPEVRAAPATADRGADGYAAAAVAYRMLTAAPPPDDAAARGAALAALDLPQSVVAPLQQALAPTPAQRPASAEEFRRRLAAARPDLDTARDRSDDGRVGLSVRATRRPPP